MAAPSLPTCGILKNDPNARNLTTIRSHYDKAEKDMIRICEEVCKAHPQIGALMLECTGMQPFARAIQREVDLPVFSWGTLLDYAYSVVVHRDYYGHV
jgi:hypothetical protein